MSRARAMHPWLKAPLQALTSQPQTDFPGKVTSQFPAPRSSSQAADHAMAKTKPSSPSRPPLRRPDQPRAPTHSVECCPALPSLPPQRLPEGEVGPAEPRATQGSSRPPAPSLDPSSLESSNPPPLLPLSGWVSDPCNQKAPDYCIPRTGRPAAGLTGPFPTGPPPAFSAGRLPSARELPAGSDVC